jgi:hypothetical protein
MTTTGPVRLAAVVYDAGFKIDDFLGRIAGRLRADRTNLAGVLQENARDDTGARGAAERNVANRLNPGPHPCKQARLPRSAS